MPINGYEYRIDQPKKGFEYILKLFVSLVFVLFLVVGIYYFTKVNRAATDESHPINFTVKKGNSSRQIASDLLEQKIINNKFVFLVYIKLHNKGNKIQAGDYLLDSNMSTPKILDVLTSGKVTSSNQNVTIVEGLSNKQIGKYLAKTGITNSDPDFEQILENSEFDFRDNTAAKKFFYQGFLFPDTYTLAKGMTVSDLIEKMLTNFENKVTDKMLRDIESKDYDLAQIITVASIIEKEVGRNKDKITDTDIATMQREREIVASVFYNRLEVGMALESDATVNYVTGKSDRSVSIDDTKIKSPYNTYLHTGLPPGPISNPGLDSIKAAIYPANTEYVYFLNAPDGTAYFARTLEEHGENREKYLR